MRKLIVSVFCFLILCSTAEAQTWKAEFAAAPNHTTIEQGVPVIDRYEILVFAPGATTPTGTPINIGKPTPTAANQIVADINTVMVTLPASPNCNVTAPTAAACYTAKVVARGPGGFTESSFSPPFALLPRAPVAWPANLVIRRN